MASTKFVSSIKDIPYNQDDVYGNLSDLKNLDKVRDRVPSQVRDFTYDQDSVSVNVMPFGEIKLRIVERDPKCIKFETEKSPVPFNAWVQLLPVTDESCKMRLTLKAELNPFIKGMVSKPMQEGLEKIATALAQVHYK